MFMVKIHLKTKLNLSPKYTCAFVDFKYKLIINITYFNRSSKKYPKVNLFQNFIARFLPHK